MLIAQGDLAAFHQDAVQKAIQADPVQAAQQTHDGSTCVVTCQGGSTVRIRRMHTAHDNQRGGSNGANWMQAARALA